MWPLAKSSNHGTCELTIKLFGAVVQAEYGDDQFQAEAILMDV